MAKSDTMGILENNSVQDKIVRLRGQDVILDFAVAEIYGVETREINQAVRNNPRKFPENYIINLDYQEFADLRSNFLIANSPKSRTLPKAFTEKGRKIKEMCQNLHFDTPPFQFALAWISVPLRRRPCRP